MENTNSYTNFLDLLRTHSWEEALGYRAQSAASLQVVQSSGFQPGTQVVFALLFPSEEL